MKNSTLKVGTQDLLNSLINLQNTIAGMHCKEVSEELSKSNGILIKELVIDISFEEYKGHMIRVFTSIDKETYMMRPIGTDTVRYIIIKNGKIDKNSKSKKCYRVKALSKNFMKKIIKEYEKIKESTELK